MLLSQKLVPPVVPINAVSRPRLFAVLDRWPNHRVTLIRAAAGYGKSSLVATWLAQRPAAATDVATDVATNVATDVATDVATNVATDVATNVATDVAWLSLDAADGDPVTFIHYLAAAVDRVVPGVLAAVEPVIADIIPNPMQGMVKLLGALEAGVVAAASPRPILIALDDYHRLKSPEVDTLTLLALERAPAHVHFLIISRSAPTVSLARLAATGLLLELTADDLRFDRTELALFMEGFAHQQLLPGQVDLLLARTEGWIAGLKLAALSVAHQDDPMAILGELHGKGRWQADYLTSEVLANQPPNIRRFLLLTSILSRFNGSLCVAVTGREEDARLLADDNSERLFLIPLDIQRTWFRYHHLFQELLQLHLETTFSAAEIREFHRRAAAWHVAEGDREVAVSHYLAAGETSAAVRLLEQLISQALNEHDLHQADVCFGLLSVDELDRSPHLLVLLCKLSVLRSEPALVANVARAERALAQWPEDSPARAGFEARFFVYAAVSAFHQRRVDELRERIRLATERQSLLDAYDRATLHVMRFHEATFGGRWDEAHQYAMLALAGYVQANSASGVINIRQELAVRLMHVGRGEEAARSLEQIIADYPLPQPNTILRDLQYTHLQMADVCYWLDDMARLRLHARAAAQLGLQFGDEFAVAIASQFLDLHNLATPEQADLEFQRTRPMHVDEGGEFLFNIEIEILYQALIGNVDKAQIFLSLLGLSPECDPLTLAPSRLVTFAQAYVAAGRDLPAIDHLMEQGLKRLRRAGALYFLGRLQATEAWRQLKLGRTDDAIEVLGAALKTAAQTGYRRPILNIPELLLLLPEIRHPLARELYDRSGRIVDRAPAAAIDLLSPRERQVLILLANDYRYRDIADQLVVSVQTVRGHVQRIYRKLGVARRLAAVEIARRAGLVS